MLLTLKYDPEYAKAYREKQRAQREAARKSGKVAAPPTPRVKPPPKAKATPVAQSVVKLDRGPELSAACACAVPAQPEILPTVTTSQSALTFEQLDALQPKRGGWTTTTRVKTLAVLKTTPAGRMLAKTIDSFQSGASANIPRLRTDIEKVLAGDTSVLPGRVEAVRNVLDAIAHSDASEKALYRGFVGAGDFATVFGQYKRGDPLNLSLSSFSSDKKLAADFGLKGAGKRVTAKTTTPVLVEWTTGPRHALPIENLGKSRVFANEREWVSAGSYRIVDVTTRTISGHKYVVLRIEQESTW